MTDEMMSLTCVARKVRRWMQIRDARIASTRSERVKGGHE